jgi:hypothetical protein
MLRICRLATHKISSIISDFTVVVPAKIVLLVNRALRLGLTHFAKAPFSPLQRYIFYFEL